MKKTHPVGRALAAVFALASMGMIFLSWLSSYASYWDLLEPMLDYLKYAVQETETLIFLIITAVFVVTGITAVICACTGAKGGVFPHIISALAAAGYFVYAISEMGGGLGDLGVGGWLCLGFAIAAFVCMFIPDTSAARPAYGGAYGGAAPVKASPSTWTCPSCGTILADRERFCPNCGSARKVTPPPAPAHAPVAPVTRAPAGWTCPGCGAKLKDSQKFCPRCGFKQPEKAAPAAPARPAAPSGWTCPGCGTKLKDSQKFCPNCGTRKPEPAAAPAPAAPVTPAYTAPAAPAFTAPAPAAPVTPTYAAPAAPAYTAPETPAYAPKHESPAPSGGFYNAGDEDL